MTLRFRPHHFLCTLGFEGKGYSPAFVANFQAIADELRAPGGDDVEIQVVSQTDSICEPCPNKQDQLCVTEAKIQTLDRAHAEELSLKAGDQLSWGEAKGRISKQISIEDFHRICAPCSWKALGVCEAALKQLKNAAGIFFLGVGLLLLSGAGNLPSAFAAPRKAIHKQAHLRSHATKKKKKVTQTSLAKRSFTARKPSSSQPAPEFAPRALKNALTALGAGKWAKARSTTEAFVGSALWADYSRWIEARSLLFEAEARISTRRTREALNLAARAKEQFSKIPALDAYSVFLKRNSEDIGAAELVVAHAHHLGKRHRQATTNFESAFQRLLSSFAPGLLAAIPLDRILAYSASCTKVQGEYCSYWNKKLAAQFPKASVETKSLANPIEETEKGSGAGGGVRTQTIYKGPEPDRIAFEEAYVKFKGRDFSDAVSAFEKFQADYPKSALRQRARYWFARGLSEAGESEKAQGVYSEILREAPLGYYALLASFGTGQLLEKFIAGALPEHETRDSALTAIERVRLGKAEMLLHSELREWAAIELKEVKPREGLSSAFLVYLASLNHQAGAHLQSFSAVTELIQRGDPRVNTTHIERFVFPVVHWEQIKRYSLEFGLDPLLVLSLMKQESAFDSGAVSSSGAVGLMQLMPATAVSTDQEIRRAELPGIENNIRIGTKYLSQLMSRFQGNIVLSLAGYNAGPNAVDRWLKEVRGSSNSAVQMLEFVEAIPYKETRDYVSSIVRNYYWYSRKLKPEQALTLDYFWSPVGPQIPAVTPAATEEASRIAPTTVTLKK